MTLLEVFNAMDEVDKPRFRVDGESFYAGVIHSYDENGEPLWTWNTVPVWLAESAVCWALVKALAKEFVGRYQLNRIGVACWGLDALHAAYQAMKEAR